ncbi:GntR family transcriptional regulator [Leucobacter sp. OLJS4]|uniref:FadR/GntR family transcriptional regulator n=1 Tax=unclassified Leucobacter TaxID=2621730 RepID=UPI00074DB822|nr:MULTISPECIES: GntR family transcriptional regulator [unclassified Leucobacter]PII82344.1 GntR family transcriptional regulator [Leucobacter sp. OLCALW19]PII87474.1 GntR family transcriptional regulator [Leucobacter sp. OLTLW20]PII94468.1 GntR family transcriptional regulator [Leucobacter sp. OLAS13]PIJ00732.1 GntR family transcriptional regulator [Leucobacter sp. OLDS2]PIJ03366.1 GntR family transcriptional regulator [Leucobacter sp. OLIS6]
MAVTTGSERARATLAYLRRKITTGDWPVGERIPIEPELAEQIGVGRSTVREAVRSLASIGMLETLPGRGTFVRSSTPTSTLLNEFLVDFTLEEILSYRRALEIEAAQQAALHRSDDDLEALEQAAADELGCNRCPVFTRGAESSAFDSRFHQLLFDAAKNRLLAALYAGINEQLRSPEHRGRLANVATATEMERDHARVLDAIRRRDFIDAVHSMADHVDHDVVIVSENQVKQPLPRTPEQEERIAQVRAGEASRA